MLLIEKNVAMAKIEELERLLLLSEEKFGALGVEFGKTNTLLELITEKCKDVAGELRRSEQEKEALRVTVGEQEETVEELKAEAQQLEVESLAMYGSHDVDTHNESDGDESSSGSCTGGGAGEGAQSIPSTPKGKQATPAGFGVDGFAVDVERLSKQVAKRDATIAELRARLEKSEESLATMSEKYMRTAVREEATAVEAELVETKMALAQAQGKRDVLNMKCKNMEKDYIKLKLELVEALNREDDQVFVNEVMQSGVDKLENEVKGLRGARDTRKEGSTSTRSYSILEMPDLNVNGNDIFSKAIRKFMRKQKDRVERVDVEESNE